ncbi:prephenate dehydrogenase [Brevibacillus humidisoli]|uniref:prephenate dehydrogenase n=1 Tax=Brevibacillus humidisoli TaxID=2895522 RepID=UPI001E436650|nr:prephenate dehydrogenase [Brevibacillus humidisoli]UFJ42768.1 prephenate dehydrogenase [Brevibacillus humidisoli]
MKTTIAVLGVGLIGGSLSLALKSNSDHRLIGFDVREDYLDKALTRGIIHAGTTDLQTAVREADFIFLAAPVQQLYPLIDHLAELQLKAGAIVSDVGSTKQKIVQYGKRLSEKQITFIGGHPMAGSHKSGVEAANERLFENAYYVLTPTDDAAQADVDRLSSVLAATRAKVIVLDPVEHDRIVGAVSHFPHIIAAALVNQVSGFNETNSWYQRLAAGGFRDITRIASSNPQLWRDILLNNREHLLEISRNWRDGLDQVMHLVAQEDAQGIEQFFSSARDFREQLPERRKGAMEPLYDLYLDIPDHPGEIGRITTLLGAKQISITNIRIMENREDIMGVLRITFRSQEELEKGEELLRYFDYNVYRRD